MSVVSLLADLNQVNMSYLFSIDSTENVILCYEVSPDTQFHAG